MTQIAALAPFTPSSTLTARRSARALLAGLGASALVACDLEEGLVDADGHLAADAVVAAEEEEEAGPALRPPSEQDIRAAAHDPEAAGLLCVLCILGGNQEVCGEDNVTYGNKCWAACEQADVVHTGPCSCGDGYAGPGEECDDGNAVDTDACTSACTTAVCGDGIVRPETEQCDDGPNNSDDLPDACRTDCSAPSCGDGVVDQGEPCDDGNTSNHDDCTNTCRAGLLPVAPTADDRMWQTVQTAFIDESATPCTGKVVVAMGDQVVCYLASDDELKCAGRVFMTDFGATFTGTGVTGAEQVLLGRTFNGADGNGMCVLADGLVRCMGRNNNTGKYGTGNTMDVPALTAWGAVTDVVRIATGTWDQVCALDVAGDVYCGGHDFGLSPVMVAGGVEHLWIDTGGILHTDDPAVWRASAGRTGCQVLAGGLNCFSEYGGPPGAVVDGGLTAGNSNFTQERCWLTDAGAVECQVDDVPVQRFTSMPVLALATNRYTDSLCAVYRDGSLACRGSNTSGKLGTGDQAALMNEQVVQPPGSVHIDCK